MIKYILYKIFRFVKTDNKSFGEVIFSMSIFISLNIYFHLLALALWVSYMNPNIKDFLFNDSKGNKLMVVAGAIVLELIVYIFIYFKRNKLLDIVIENKDRSSKKLDIFIYLYILLFWIILMILFWI